ncbi:unnamed protein product [Closterium sp. NIES-64]|nr:unnamed protein product [Closterium sp. NIES-64]
MDVARTSMIHAAAPHFLWPFTVQYAAHQLNLQPRVSMSETTPALRWTRKVGDASAFRVCVPSRAFVHDSSADKLSSRAVPCVFLGISPDAPGWQFYHPTSRRDLSSKGVTFDESVPYYRLFPYRIAPLPPPPRCSFSHQLSTQVLLGVLSLQVRGLGVLSLRVRSLNVLSLGLLILRRAEPGGAEPKRAEPEGTLSSRGPTDVLSQREPLSPPQLHEWFAWRASRAAGAGGPTAGGAAGTRGTAGAVAAGGAGGAGPGGARTGGTGAAGAGGAAGVGAGGAGAVTAGGATGAGAVGGAGAGGTAGVGVGDPGAGDSESDSLRAASPIITRLLATLTFVSTAASTLVAELVDFAATCHLDYAASLVAESESVCPPSVGGESVLGTDVLENMKEEFQCFAAAVPHLVSILIAPEGDPDAPDILTPRSYAEAIEGSYSPWQSAMDVEMASWNSTGTYIDEVPPLGANIVSGMWIFRVKQPPSSPPVFKARYVARGFNQQHGVDFFQTFSSTSKITTLWVLLHVAAQRDNELHSLNFSTAFLQGSLHEEIWLRRPPGFTWSFPVDTQWSFWQPVYGLRHVPREWHDTLRTTLAALRFAPSTADPLLFLRTDTSMPPFYIFVHVVDLVFAFADILNWST